MLGDIFGGLFTLFPEGQAIGAASPCSLSAITAFCRNNSGSALHWEQVLQLPVPQPCPATQPS